MTHRPPNELLVFMSGHICISFHVVVGAYMLAVYRQVVCRPYCALQPCRTDIWQVLLVNSSCIKNTGRGYDSERRLDMSSRQHTVRPCLVTVYAVARPVEQQVINRLVGFDHDNYRSIAKWCWLNTSARVYCQCGCPLPHIPKYSLHEEMAPDFFRKFTGKTRPCAQTILYRFRWQFQFRRVGLSVLLIVGELVYRRVSCRRVGLSASWSVGELSSYLVYSLCSSVTGCCIPDQLFHCCNRIGQSDRLEILINFVNLNTHYASNFDLFSVFFIFTSIYRTVPFGWVSGSGSGCIIGKLPSWDITPM